MTSSEVAKIYLKTYWENASNGLSFSEMIDLMQAPTGTFLQNFGSACISAEKSLGATRVHDKMRELAKITGGKVTTYPDGSFRGQEFFDILYRGVQSWDLKRIAKTTAEISLLGAEKIASVGGMVLSTYVILGALGFALAIYQLTKGKK